MRIAQLTVSQAEEGLRRRIFSAKELVKSCLDRIQKWDSKINAFITIREEAVQEGERVDEKIQKGDSKSLFSKFPLLGIPIAVKDLYCTSGLRTTAGSKVLENYLPVYDATVVSRLKKAGVVIIGKTNLDAWGHGSSGENSDFGPTRNPWNFDYVPGGSSSGSGAALAAGMALAATGTDTGGSIRLPAGFCNLVGLKPTYGRVSRYGVVAMASSLDSMGHFTKTVSDSALILGVTAGKDECDASTPSRPVPDYLKNIDRGVKGIKIGVPKEFFTRGIVRGVEDKIMEAIKRLENLGGEIVGISLPHTQYALAVYYIIQPSEVSSNLARYDGIRYGISREAFGDEAKRRIMLGTYTLSAGYYEAYYSQAMKVRTLIVGDFIKAFEKVDVIVAPVSPTLPFKLGEKITDPLKMYLSDIYTATASLAGIPGLVVPVGFVNSSTGSLPVGMQILGPQFSEELLFQVGYAYERVTDWHRKWPELL